MPLEDAEALSAESGYLQEKLGVALTCGLAEVSRAQLTNSGSARQSELVDTYNLQDSQNIRERLKLIYNYPLSSSKYKFTPNSEPRSYRIPSIRSIRTIIQTLGIPRSRLTNGTAQPAFLSITCSYTRTRHLLLHTNAPAGLYTFALSI